MEDKKLEEIREYVDRMIKGGEMVEMLAKGNEFYEAKGALLAYKSIKELLQKEG